MNKRKVILICLSVFLAIVVVKMVWVRRAVRGHGSFESEKKEILQRRNWLVSKIVTEPEKLLNEMPGGIGPQFQGEWALYSCSMLSASLVNIALLYPETASESLVLIDSLISIASSPEIRQYDAIRWGEDPLESLDGDQSHVSYLSHLAWMISGYKQLGGGKKYDKLYHRLCETMNRRILHSPILNLQTYPREYVYVPDMLVAIVALANYSRQYGGRYASTVQKWTDNVRTKWTDPETGLLMSLIPDGKVWIGTRPIKGSYTALSCYYLTFVDRDYALNQYERLKKYFLKRSFVTGFKEYHDRSCLFALDMDAGPVLFNLSPTGTAFSLGSVSYFEDFELRRKILKTAELAGWTVSSKGKTHYMLANLALVGEAITLAMRTAVPWE